MAELIRTENDQGRSTQIDYMARDYASLLQAMRSQIPDKLPEWQDFSAEADFGNVLLQLFAHMGDLLNYYLDRAANESFLLTARNRRSVIQHLRLIGYRLATAAPAAAALTLVAPATCNEIVEIRRGDAFATKSRKDRSSVRFEYTREVRLRIDCSTLPVDADGRKRFPGIPVEEGRLVRGEVLGQSDGTANQRFPLTHAPVIMRALGANQALQREIILTSESGGVIQPWTWQETLAFSRAGQTDFALEIDEADRATVLFGDGNLGAIPAPGSTLRVTYRVGGGAQGNVPANTIQTIVDAPQLALLGITVTNPQPATGGAERESIEHAVNHAPNVFRSLKRAVTAADYKALALDFQGVGKVRAEAVNWNRVTLYVAPQGGGQVSDLLRANLLAYFEDKRPLSTIIEIEDVDYVNVYVSAEVGVKGYYATEEITEQVQSAAARLLAFDAVDFGQTLFLSKFYEAIEAVAGVDYVTITEFRRDGQTVAVEPEGKLTFQPNELPKIPDGTGEERYFGGIAVNASGGH